MIFYSFRSCTIKWLKASVHLSSATQTLKEVGHCIAFYSVIFTNSCLYIAFGAISFYLLSFLFHLYYMFYFVLFYYLFIYLLIYLFIY